MFKHLYDRCRSMANHRHAPWALAGVSFVESSFFPVPPDVLLAPMVLSDKARAWRHALVCTLASVAGAVLGYLIGRFLFALIGMPIFETYGAMDAFDKFTGFYADWGVWIVLISAVSFVPFKVATIASGVVTMEPVSFIIACLVGRGIRFYGVTGVLLFDLRGWLYQAERRSLLIALISATVLLTALAMEHIGGMAPCPLCLDQRLAYYAAIPLGLVAAILAWRQSRFVDPLLYLIALIYLVNAGLGSYHAGIEWGFWPGPASCSGAVLPDMSSVEALHQALQNTTLVRCDEATWRLFGLSLAGYNVLISLGLAMLAGWSWLIRLGRIIRGMAA